MEDKERQRYLLFKIISEEEIEEKQLIRAIWKNLFQLYGDFGTSQTGLWLIEYDNNVGFLRTNVQSLQMVRTALAVIRKIDDKNCIFVVEGVSGTLNSLKRKYFLKITSDIQ